MLNRKELLGLIGKTIVVIPVQNNVRRGISLKEQLSEFTLEKVGSKNFLITDGSYPIDGSDNRYNAGYKPFRNKQEALDYLKAIELERELKRTPWSHLSLKELEQIETIIGVES